jgi:hypothetical protein
MFEGIRIDIQDKREEGGRVKKEPGKGTGCIGMMLPSKLLRYLLVSVSIFLQGRLLVRVGIGGRCHEDDFSWFHVALIENKGVLCLRVLRLSTTVDGAISYDSQDPDHADKDANTATEDESHNLALPGPECIQRAM